MSQHALPFPVGYHRFHKSQLFNFTLNRWHSIGQARLEDTRDAGRAIRRYEDWKPEMVRIADRAADDGRLLNASIYCRSAEFYALPQDSDRKLLYDRFRDLFNAAFQGEEIERVRIPFDGAYLPAMRVAPEGVQRGTVLLHGGYHSFLEE